MFARELYNTVILYDSLVFADKKRSFFLDEPESPDMRSLIRSMQESSSASYHASSNTYRI